MTLQQCRGTNLTPTCRVTEPCSQYDPAGPAVEIKQNPTCDRSKILRQASLILRCWKKLLSRSAGRTSYIGSGLDTCHEVLCYVRPPGVVPLNNHFCSKAQPPPSAKSCVKAAGLTTFVFFPALASQLWACNTRLTVLCPARCSLRCVAAGEDATTTLWSQNAAPDPKHKTTASQTRRWTSIAHVPMQSLEARPR